MIRPPRILRTRWLPWGPALFWLFTSCGEKAEEYPPPVRLALPAEAVTLSFGKEEDEAGVEDFSIGWVAALSPSGRFLAVGDRVAPFLRILDRSTDSAFAFGERGEGPGELTSVSALDFQGDSVLFVLGGRQRLERFRVTGEWAGGYRMSDSGLLVSSIAVGCGERVFAYGIPAATRRADTVPWVHRLHLGEQLSSTPLLAIPGKARMTYGALYGFDGTPDGVLLWHRAGEAQAGYWVPCDGGPPTLWSGAAQEELEAISAPSGNVFQLPDTLFYGAVARGPARVRARSWKDGSQRVTGLYVASGGECREIQLLGGWFLHDAHQEGLVLAGEDPFPTVKILDWGWLESHITPQQCPT